MHGHTAVVHSPERFYVFVYHFVLRGGNFDFKKYEIS
jgi:hypothetical protein